MMRIAYVCTDQGIPVFGRKGCSIHVQEVIRAMIAQGAEVHLFTPRGEGNVPAGLEPVRLHLLPIADQKDAALREQASFRANSALRQALAMNGQFDIIYERYALWSHAGMDFAQAARIPGILEVNAPLIDEQRLHRVLIDHANAEWVAHRAFGNATALIAVSREVAAYLRQYPQTESRVWVIPNGVNPERFAGAHASSERSEGTFTVGFVGTLKPWHGVSTLIEAFQRLHGQDAATRLLIVGDGPERSKLEADVKRRGLSKAVHFQGAVDPAEVPGSLRSMDVATAPYPRLPGFYFSPLKVFEYMAAGKAVVASRIGQLTDLVEHEKTGLLCNPGDARDLAEALTRLRQEPTLRDRLGQEARTRICRDHTWKAAVDKIFDLAEPALPAAIQPVGACS
ncbi:MAG: glycosyltransferase family 4 protein [Isosphaeraceae bacterium]